jgi:dTDP-4-amino-4,6-dideoxygalactose transaminase
MLTRVGSIAVDEVRRSGRHDRRKTVYVPAQHGLDPAVLLRRRDPAGAPFPMSAPRRFYFHRARNAIYHLCRALGFDRGQTVLVPDYHNGNEVRAIRAAGADVRFYRVDRQLELDLEHLTRVCRTTDARALFVIHYFGWPQPVKELVALCEARDMVLIEDCALSLLSETMGQPLGSFGRYATFCLYKTLPVPNGGVLVENEGALESLERLALRPCGIATRAGRTLELSLEWFRGRAHAPGQAAFALKRAGGRALQALRVPREPFGDLGFDLESVDIAAMPLSLRLLERFDYAAIRRRRCRNFQALYDRLAPRALVPRELEPGVCPLLFPLLVPDKPGAAAALRRRGIDALEFWNDGDPAAGGPAHADAMFLRRHLVELPIHQDLTPAQVEHMATQVLSLGLHCAR